MKNLIRVLFVLLASVAQATAQMWPGPGLPLPIPIVSYRTNVTDAANLTTYTWAGVDIGTQDPNRLVAIICTAGNGTATVVEGSSSIAGVTTAKPLEIAHSTYTTTLLTASVPTGTTGTISVTYSGGQTRAGCGVWALYNLQSTTPVLTATSTASPPNLDMNIIPGQILLVGTSNNNGTITSPTGYTERYNVETEAPVRIEGGDYRATAYESPRTITATYTGGVIFPALAAIFR